MSRAEIVASALNAFIRDRLDMMGGANGEEMDRLVEEFINLGDEEGSNPLPE